MIRAPVLVRVSWRIESLSLPVIWLVLAGVYFSLATLAGASTGLFDQRLNEHGEVAGRWALSVSAGVVTAWAAHDILLVPISVLLPGLRRRLSIETLVGFAALSILLGLTRAHDQVATMSVCFVGCAFGLYAANPSRFRTVMPAVAIVVLLGALAWASDPAANGIDVHPWIGVPVAGALGTLLVLGAYGRAAHRSLQQLDSEALLSRRPKLFRFDLGRDADRKASIWARPWGGAPTRLRGTLHELHGTSPGGWIGFALSQTAGVLILFVFVRPVSASPPGGSVWSGLARNWVAENPDVWRTLVVFWLVIVLSWALRTPCIPRTAIVRPWSRADRARDAWSVTALRTGVALGGVLIVLSAIGAYALNRSIAAGDAIPAVRGLPDIVGALFVVALLAPWGAWVRLRQHDLDMVEARYPGTRRSFGVALLTVFVGIATAQLLGSVWFRAEEIHPALAPLLFAVLLAGSWAAFRLALQRLFRTATLPV